MLVPEPAGLSPPTLGGARRAIRTRSGHDGPLRQRLAPARIFPDQMAPVIRPGADGRELAALRWDFPSPPRVQGNRPVTDIRTSDCSTGAPG